MNATKMLKIPRKCRPQVSPLWHMPLLTVSHVTRWPSQLVAACCGTII